MRIGTDKTSKGNEFKVTYVKAVSCAHLSLASMKHGEDEVVETEAHRFPQNMTIMYNV